MLRVQVSPKSEIINLDDYEIFPYVFRGGRRELECWQAIPEHFPNTDVDEFVVMPNHIHGIVWIDTDIVGADGVRPVKNAGAHHAGASLPLSGTMCAPTPKTEIIGIVYCRF
jgi:hypothetical protein